jgi:hypothetical protein
MHSSQLLHKLATSVGWFFHRKTERTQLIYLKSLFSKPIQAIEPGLKTKTQLTPITGLSVRQLAMDTTAF